MISGSTCALRSWIMASCAVLVGRLRGSLYGLVSGDALGGPYEFRRRGSYEVSPDMVESETFQHKGKPLPAGTWTDDTRC
jgi:ADP-ribosyl-[dinitrogen reductase] hydrolase